MSMKKLMTIAAMALAVTAIAGTANAETAKKALVFGYAVQDLGNQYWVKVAEGVKDQAKEMGVSVVVMDARTDAARELANVDDMIQKKVDAVLLSPWDANSGANAVAQANKAKIPVFVLDIGVASGDIESLIVSDNLGGGKIAGKYIADMIKPGAEVAHISCQPGYVIPALRGKGFTEIMNQTGMKIVAAQSADSQRAKGMNVMQNILQAHPNLQAVFAENDEMALGAIEAVAAAGKSAQVKVVGFDGTDDARAAIKDGRLAGTVAQVPYEMGKLGVKTAVAFLGGKTVEKTTYVPVELVTPAK
ncbi:MAG: substrate-binding domain-containing protein [Ancalomicrobiaceae bacterium]|nr:substrate-binding domain-containing protein [Ancalomicrobiaceae bacterium]